MGPPLLSSKLLSDIFKNHEKQIFQLGFIFPVLFHFQLNMMMKPYRDSNGWRGSNILNSDTQLLKLQHPSRYNMYPVYMHPVVHIQLDHPE